MQITVVGAGIIGLSIAWRLHRDGHRITVVDPAPASGATHAAGGMLTPVGEAWHGEDDLTALLLASARRYASFVEDVSGHLSAGTPTGYSESGTLICGADAADRGDLTALHELCRRLELRSEQITTREARRLEPLLGPHVSCAFLAPEDHQVDPRVWAAALIEALTGQGTRFVTKSVECVTAGQGPSVTTGAGTQIESDLVVVAAGLGARGLQGDLGVDLDHVLRPVHGEVVRLRVPAHLTDLLTHTVRGQVSGRPVYLIPRGDSRVLLGATSREDGIDAVNAGGIHDLLADAIRLMPAVREFAVEDVVARARPGTPDNSPIIGETTPGIIVADGFFRHGILLSTIAGDIVSALVRRHTGESDAHTGDLATGVATVPGPPAGGFLPDAELLDLARCADPARFASAPSPHRKDTP